MDLSSIDHKHSPRLDRWDGGQQEFQKLEGQSEIRTISLSVLANISRAEGTASVLDDFFPDGEATRKTLRSFSFLLFSS